MSPLSPGSHFMSMPYTYSRSMHYVSPLSPLSHQASMPFAFRYFGRSRSPVSHRSHYMNYAKIYPFSDDLCPQWTLGATSYQCHIHLAARCTMCPHWAPGATRLQHPLHLAISDVPGPLSAIGATIWTMSRSIHFQTLLSPMNPGSHFISVSCTSSRSVCYVFQLSLGSHQASTPFTFSYYGRVSQRSHCMNHVKIYPFSTVLCPQWALGGTSYECHIHLAARCTMCPHWAAGAIRLQHPFISAISDVLVPCEP